MEAAGVWVGTPPIACSRHTARATHLPSGGGVQSGSSLASVCHCRVDRQAARPICSSRCLPPDARALAGVARDGNRALFRPGQAVPGGKIRRPMRGTGTAAAGVAAR